MGMLITFYRNRFYAHCHKCGESASVNLPITTPNWSLYVADFKSRTVTR